MVKRILVGVCDPLYSASAASYACEIAKRFDAEVSVIAVTDVRHLVDVGPTPVGASSFTSELMRERIENNEKAIRESQDLVVGQLLDANIPHHVLQVDGSPDDALVRASRYHDLMVFGLQGLLEHGVTSEPPHELVHLMESGVRPILAVGAEHRQTKRVLIAYSGSVESARTMKTFATLDLWRDARMKVIHFGKRSGEGSALLTDARSYLKDHELNVETELIEDSPKTSLLKEAEAWNADLIVLGNSAKSLLRRRVFGETALNTIRESQIPLFLSQ